MTNDARIDFRPGALTEPLSGRHWDREAVARETGRRAVRYRQEGVTAGDPVFLLHGNRLEFFADLLALWSLGACAIPIDARLTPFEIATLAAAAAPRFALADGGLDAPILAALWDSGAVLIDGKEGAAGPVPPRPSSSGASDPDGAALVLFTSGTTGQPKGVVHTHRSLQARWADLRTVLGVGPFRRTLCLLPTHFGHGLICNCLYPWLSGCDLLVLPPFQADLIMQLGTIIDEHDVTFMSSVPAMWHLALKMAQPPRRESLERVICGSAPLSARLWGRIQEWSGTRDVLNAYGITETASWVAGTTVPAIVPEDGLIGVGWGADIRILQSNTTATAPGGAVETARGQVGYVWLRTPALMRGYLGRDDLTAAAVRDGWLSTSDLGFVDERGYLFLTGREREEVNRGGLKIYPGDVDAVAERHGAVIDVCAFAFEHPTSGQELGIALVMSRRDPGTLRSLYDLMAAHLAPHQLPQRWFLMDAIPRSSLGKVNRHAVADACAQLTPVNLRDLLHHR
jgi:acyl-CoA synthetase (AMP-forming)/AMP-acid ligase II